MAGYRLNKRLDCEEFCHLHLRDSFYPARVENISLGGALVHFFYPLPGIRVGDNIKMTLSRETTFEFDCEVIRVVASDVALKFIDIDVTKSFVQ